MTEKRNPSDIDPNAPATHGDLTLLTGQIQHQFKEVDDKFEEVYARLDRLDATIERNHKEMISAMGGAIENQMVDLGAARSDIVQLVQEKQQDHEMRIVALEQK